jgi:hypothetical protein
VILSSVRKQDVGQRVAAVKNIRRHTAVHRGADGLTIQLRPGISETVALLQTLQGVLGYIVARIAHDLAEIVDGRQGLVDSVFARNFNLPVELALESLRMLDGRRRIHTIEGRTVAAIVHLIHINHGLASAYLRRVAHTRHVTLSLTALTGVMEVRCAITLVAVLDTEKGGTADVLAEVEADLRSY